FHLQKISDRHAKLTITICSFGYACGSALDGNLLYPREILGDGQQQNHVSKGHGRFGREPPIGLFSEYSTRTDGLPSGNRERRRAEFHPPAKSSSLPGSYRPIEPFFPVT